MKSFILSTFILLTASLANAAIKTQTIEYKEGDTVLEGYLA
jgi:hypothetical protein